jgi:hypothetical protein
VAREANAYLELGLGAAKVELNVTERKVTICTYVEIAERV